MKKTNNKGFSLVELIIVIAIMAVLVGVLAPAYMRYVENARKSRDISAMDSVLNTVEASLIDASVRGDGAYTVTIHVDDAYASMATSYPGAPTTAVTGGSIWFEVVEKPQGAATASLTANAKTLGSELYDVLGVYEIAGDWEYDASGTMTDCNPQVITATVNGNSVVFTPANTTGGAADAMDAYSSDLGNRLAATPAPAGS